jgi:tRNA-binding EMAP/Myf-like protein
MDADADADDDVVAAKNNICNNINHKSEGMVLKAKTVAEEEEEDIVVFEEVVHVTESTK